MMASFFNGLENILGNGENYGYQYHHFLLLSSPEQEVLKMRYCNQSVRPSVRSQLQKKSPKITI